VQVEEAFKNLKGDLALRPVYHQKLERIQAHILVAFISHTLHVCLRQRLKAVAGGLTPRAVLEKFCAMQMVDVHLPKTDGRTVIITRHTQAFGCSFPKSITTILQYPFSPPRDPV